MGLNESVVTPLDVAGKVAVVTIDPNGPLDYLARMAEELRAAGALAVIVNASGEIGLEGVEIEELRRIVEAHDRERDRQMVAARALAEAELERQMVPGSMVDSSTFDINSKFDVQALMRASRPSDLNVGRIDAAGNPTSPPCQNFSTARGGYNHVMDTDEAADFNRRLMLTRHLGLTITPEQARSFFITDVD